MNKTLTFLTVSALALASASALADDKTVSTVTPAEQIGMKQESDARKAALAEMTPVEKAVARKARDAERLSYESTIEKITQNPGEARNMAINKSAAASKAGPTPRRDTMNTPEGYRVLLDQKGQ